jgi:1,4-dihydroxy-2-naphthoate octaprenyltransferase
MRSWIKAARLRTLPLATASVFAGTSVALANGEWSGAVFILALLTAIGLQVLSNFANDLGDYLKGTDNENRIGPARTLQSGELSVPQMKRAVVFMSVFSLISGIGLLWIALGDRDMFGIAMIMLAIGLIAIGAAIKYTVGKASYGYSGFGDLAVFIFFGIVAVVGTAFLHSADTDSLSGAIAPAVMIGAFSTAVLNLNNLRDHENDALSGKRTMVVRMGFDLGRLYHLLLIITGIVSLVYSALCMNPAAQLSVLFVFPFALHLKRVMNAIKAASLDKELKIVAVSTFAVSLSLFILNML